MGFSESISRIQSVEAENRAQIEAAEAAAEKALSDARAEAANLLAQARTQSEESYTADLDYHRISIKAEKERVVAEGHEGIRTSLSGVSPKQAKVVAMLSERLKSRIAK